jgi:sortase A
MKLLTTARIPITLALLIIGAAVAIYPQVTEWRYAWAQQAMVQEAAAASSAATTTAAAGAGVDSGMPMPRGAVARVVVSAIGLDAFVVQGVEKAQLDRAVGHYPETPLPGEQGNAALAGHRTMFGHPFRRLNELKRGDTIETWTTKSHAVYQVVKIARVDPGNVGVIAPSKGRTITLTTCNPVGSARERLIVTGELVAN